MLRTYFIIIFILFLFAEIISCDKILPSAPADNAILDGPIEGLTGEQNAQFLAGDVAFNDEVFVPETGLGPIFVANSCGSCHAKDGKGHPFTTLIRFGQTDSTGNHFLHTGGPQIQNRAINGFTPEQIPTGVGFSKFIPPANTGLGLIEAVPDTAILAMADPDDLDSDGISGVPNWNTIPPYIIPLPGANSRNGKYITRFGKKASVYSLMQQTVGAYNQDMGINSEYEPYDVYTGNMTDPEVSLHTVNNVVFYLRTLKAPIQRNQNDPTVVEGKRIFSEVGCENCHRSTLKTGSSSIAPLAFKEIHPYTDLLLHDMGAGLDDGYTEGMALTSEWRTPALWGLGLSKNSQGGGYHLLHDGRAKSIEEAIFLHGGEATRSSQLFQHLSSTDRIKLIAFLESL
jgi:CxxC motif-containing protein (DUF1111 family)